MKIRKMRKKFWFLSGLLVRSHSRKVKPLPGTRWQGLGRGVALVVK